MAVVGFNISNHLMRHECDSDGFWLKLEEGFAWKDDDVTKKSTLQPNIHLFNLVELAKLNCSTR